MYSHMHNMDQRGVVGGGGAKIMDKNKAEKSVRFRWNNRKIR